MPSIDSKGLVRAPWRSVVACALLAATTVALADADPGAMAADSGMAKRSSGQIVVPELQMVRQDGTPTRN
jgi:hypothetical protein